MSVLVYNVVGTVYFNVNINYVLINQLCTMKYVQSGLCANVRFMLNSMFNFCFRYNLSAWILMRTYILVAGIMVC